MVSRILLSSFNNNKLASTYLFYGADGRGKWAVAIGLAALVNCEEPIKDNSGKVADSCGNCRNCRQIENLIFPELHFAVPITTHKNEDEANDLVRGYLNLKAENPYRIINSGPQIVAAANDFRHKMPQIPNGKKIKDIAIAQQLTIPIELAREIKRKTAIRPYGGTKRIIIFYQMEKMLQSSADALLKLIEEPPPETIIVITAVDPDALLPTIKSRSQRIRFRPISDSIIAQYLFERHNVESEKASFLARLSEGSIGQAVLFIEDGDMSSFRQTAFLLFKSIFARETSSAMAAFSDLINPMDKSESEQLLNYWQSFLGDLIRIKSGMPQSGILNIDLGKELENLAGKIASAADFSAMLGYIKRMNQALRRNIHIRIGMIALLLGLRQYINQNP